jgi:hypothetical protein
MEYKLRAECINDIDLFIGGNKGDINNYYVIDSLLYPDAELIFDTNLSLREIIEKLKALEDSHVMYQTVQPIKHYTGNRNYNL